MKGIIVLTAAMLAAGAPAAYAQASSNVSLAEVAKKEEQRRKTAKKATRVLTNASLGPVEPRPEPAAAPVVPDTTPANTTPTISGGQAPPVPPVEAKDQAYWSGRIGKARADLGRMQIFAESLQTRINALRTDFVNRDNRVEREKIEQDLNAALAELERVKKETDAQTKAIADIEDEARRANVPPGWLRPSA